VPSFCEAQAKQNGDGEGVVTRPLPVWGRFASGSAVGIGVSSGDSV
jgi:hypothetical protein